MRIVRLMGLLAASAMCAAAQEQRPLDASLRRGAFEALFAVNEPAYVAVFEAISGQGIHQLFPRSSAQAQRPVDAGEYLLSRSFRTPYGGYGSVFARPYARPVWMLDAAGRIAGYYYTTGWNGTYGHSMPYAYAPARTLLLVASRFPLRQVDSPEAAQHWLQRAVGFSNLTFAVAPTQSTFDQIVAAVLPTGAGVDDVVVDVLDLVEQDDAWYRYAASQSITFRCPGSMMYTMRAEFFFDSGDFYCPSPRIAVNGAPAAPVDSAPAVEGYKPRRVPTKTDVAPPEEGVRMLPRGVRPTPATPSVQSAVEEGVRFYNGRRAGGEVDGRRAFGGGEGVGLPAHSRVLIGDPPGVDGSVRPRGAGSVITAYVPPGAPASVDRTFRGRPVPEGRDGGAAPFTAGSNTAWSTANASSATSASTAAASASATANAAAQAAQSAQAAQASRSAESRATVNADRNAATGRVPPQP